MQNYKILLYAFAFDTNFQLDRAKAILKGELHARHIDTVTAVPHYNVDIHIDEAKLNEDKNAVTITPILGRIHSIQPTATHKEGTKIILDTSVFVIGFYVGKGKPDYISSFLSELIVNSDDCPHRIQIVRAFKLVV
ncbi:hypothetical protein OUZ56_010144 [Daphnia magna]|uniref:Uncharacterized protein n=1 Tax=Daphnia magna TaxID=35525 RepID=A0ABR0AHX7_9CRUS|nr:hypothetical protein OUZ56_010144 [Daphnia magna]